MKKIVPSFVIEFVSGNDDIRKLSEYFKADVQVVWIVLPDDFTVYIYTSPKTVIIATDADLLSATPALPDLHITVEELFRR